MDKLNNVISKVGVIKKTQDGVYNNKYADIPAIMAKLQPLLDKEKLMVSHFSQDKAINTVVIDVESGDQLAHSSVSLEYAKGLTPQDFGSAVTYFRRYNLQMLFNLVIEGEDDDGQGAQDKVVSYQDAKVPANDIVL